MADAAGRPLPLRPGDRVRRCRRPGRRGAPGRRGGSPDRPGLQTVHNVVPGEGRRAQAAYDVVLAGDDEPVPIARRPAIRAMVDSPDGRTALAWYARVARELGERTLRLVTVLQAQAAGGDPDLVAQVETIEGERATGTRRTAELAAGRFGLRPGLDVDAAADVLWTLTAPDVADRLVRRRAWGWDRYEAWPATAMGDALLGP